MTSLTLAIPQGRADSFLFSIQFFRSWSVAMTLIYYRNTQKKEHKGLLLLSIAIIEQSNLYKINSYKKVCNRLQKNSGSPAFRVKTLGHGSQKTEDIWEQKTFGHIVGVMSKGNVCSQQLSGKEKTNMFIWSQNNLKVILCFQVLNSFLTFQTSTLNIIITDLVLGKKSQPLHNPLPFK